jgi:O-antigen/teichoic acid export membrane protein
MFSGYLLMGVNVLYTFFSIPLALHYLGKEEFGLWALAQQISGYLMLLDLGMSSALSRFLADHKDEREGEEYGSMFLTGSLVFLIQGVIITLVGVAFSFMAPTLFSIPLEMRQSFTIILSALSVLAGLSVMLRSVGSPLWAFQRLDVSNLVGAGGLLLGLGFLWFGFHHGWGLYSLVIAGIPGLVVGTVVAWAVCHWYGYYPQSGHWGQPKWELFKKIFGFGKDVVLISLGSQLVNASQIMIISRFIGLEAAATFAVATKFYTLGQQFVSKILEGAAPTLTEMYVRGDRERFQARLSQVIVLTMAMAVIGGSCLALGNRALIFVWTSGAVSWSWAGDLLLALLILITSVSRCCIGSFGIAGDLKPVRSIYLVEGIIFVFLAMFLAHWMGLWGILLAALLAHLTATVGPSMQAVRAHLGERNSLFKQLSLSLLILALGALGGGIGERMEFSPFLNLTLLPLMAGISSLLAWQYLLPYDLKEDLRSKFNR